MGRRYNLPRCTCRPVRSHACLWRHECVYAMIGVCVCRVCPWSGGRMIDLWSEGYRFDSEIRMVFVNLFVMWNIIMRICCMLFWVIYRWQWSFDNLLNYFLCGSKINYNKTVVYNTKIIIKIYNNFCEDMFIKLLRLYALIQCDCIRICKVYAYTCSCDHVQWYE